MSCKSIRASEGWTDLGAVPDGVGASALSDAGETVALREGASGRLSPQPTITVIAAARTPVIKIAGTSLFTFMAHLYFSMSIPQEIRLEHG